MATLTIKILYLSFKIKCYKVKLVHNIQRLIVPEDISVKVRCLFWGGVLFLATFAFMVELGKAFELDPFMNKARV